MAKSSTKPVNGPSTTGNQSGGGRGNNPPKKWFLFKTAGFIPAVLSTAHTFWS